MAFNYDLATWCTNSVGPDMYHLTHLGGAPFAARVNGVAHFCHKTFRAISARGLAFRHERLALVDQPCAHFQGRVGRALKQHSPTAFKSAALSSLVP